MEQVAAAAAFVGASFLLNESTKSRKVSDNKDYTQKPKFLTQELAERIGSTYNTPLYVYDEASLTAQAQSALAFPAPYGFRVRFAMKACPNANVLRLFYSLGLSFDASSGHEVKRALRAGIPASNISLSAQELPSRADFKSFIDAGVHFNACSLRQLETFGQLWAENAAERSGSGVESPAPGSHCGVRFNPGVGSGGTGKTNVGGPCASFGIWHEQAEKVKEVADKYGISICRIHTHIGSGSDPAVWSRATHLSLTLVEQFPDAHTLNLGGGYKVARMQSEKATDLQVIGEPVKQLIEDFATRSGRKLDLEIEPGTYLVANAGCLLCKVADIVDTLGPWGSSGGKAGYRFIKLDAGMTEMLRPSMYGAQHPILLLSDKDRVREQAQAKAQQPDSESTSEQANPVPLLSIHNYVVVGHCCESGDLFSCAPGEPEVLREVSFDREVKVGSYVSMEGAGAYCSSMSTKNYNSYPEVAEVMLKCDGAIKCIRKVQTLEQIVQNEVYIDF
jgi:diaminopimelate decarboxylase